ncbi:MAG: RNA 2'-phosphotransferase [candidate division Zixibacteria bacterium]|nr:RNA 2'-phosphotransferase [candidate division Zixibacteria bacterium]
MNEIKREGLSRLLSLMLRHKPERFEIELDAQGYAALEDVVDAAQEKYADVTREEIFEVVEGGDKRRFETNGDRIRARYGHSFPIDLGLPPMVPPEYLYYATAPDQAGFIIANGLSPGDRQFVHLSMDKEIAAAVAGSRTRTHVMFRVLARQASETGISFYDRTPVYLTHGVPPRFIEIDQEATVGRFALYGRRKRLKMPRPHPSSSVQTPETASG